MAYIALSEITDSVAKKFVEHNDNRCDIWLERTDEEVVMLASELGIAETSIVVPLHPRIQAFARAMFCKTLFFDVIGSNNIDTPETEKHKVKYELYNNEVLALKQKITKTMFDSKPENSIGENTVTAGILWRG